MNQKNDLRKSFTCPNCGHVQVKANCGQPAMEHQEHIRKLRMKIRVLEKQRDLYYSVMPLIKRGVDRIVEKKPDYYYSFAGLQIFRQWYGGNGLQVLHAEILIILSYYTYFLNADKKYWNISKLVYKKPMSELIQMGYVIKVKVPGKSRSRKRFAFVLTKKGRDLEADYEKYYDAKIGEFMKKKYGSLSLFDSADYFRREKKSREERREEQGGGPLPKGRQIMKAWRDRPYPEEPVLTEQTNG